MGVSAAAIARCRWDRASTLFTNTPRNNIALENSPPQTKASVTAGKVSHSCTDSGDYLDRWDLPNLELVLEEAHVQFFERLQWGGRYEGRAPTFSSKFTASEY